jgi:hypothetical protein
MILLRISITRGVTGFHLTDKHKRAKPRVPCPPYVRQFVTLPMNIDGQCQGYTYVCRWPDKLTNVSYVYQFSETDKHNLNYVCHPDEWTSVSCSDVLPLLTCTCENFTQQFRFQSQRGDSPQSSEHRPSWIDLQVGRSTVSDMCMLL